MALRMITPQESQSIIKKAFRGGEKEFQRPVQAPKIKFTEGPKIVTSEMTSTQGSKK